MRSKVQFTPAGGSEFSVYTPAQLTALYYEPYYHFESINTEKGRIFARVLVRGKLTLYEDLTNTKQELFFLVQPNGEIIELMNTHTIIEKDNKGLKKPTTNMLSVLA